MDIDASWLRSQAGKRIQQMERTISVENGDLLRTRRQMDKRAESLVRLLGEVG